MYSGNNFSNANVLAGAQIAGQVAANQQAAANAAPAQDDVPWWLRYGARGAGLGGGILAMILGVWTCLQISASCIIGGIWLMLAGFVVVALEAPCCCMFVDFVQQFSHFADNRPHWQKAVGYTVLAIPDIILCPGISTIFGSAFIIISAVLYGMMALGKKAPRAEMIARAQSTQNVTLVDDKGQPRDVEAARFGGRT